jgi:hypothetical protein
MHILTTISKGLKKDAYKDSIRPSNNLAHKINYEVNEM